jgi:NitT/TauT family transport system substrate-binding protein
MGTHLVAQAVGRNLPSWTILVFLRTAIVVTVCRKQPEKSAEPPEKVTTAYSAILHTGLFHIVFTKGFFLAESLEVTPQPHPFGKVALGAVLQGKANLATVARWTSETKTI